MQLNFLDPIGDWNPQLFREIKGRLKVRNIALAVGTSLFGQLLLILYWLSQLPNESYSVWGQYCRLRDTYQSYEQQLRQLETKYRQLQAQFSQYSGSEHFDLERLNQIKGQLEPLKERIEDLRQVLSNGICPPEAINLELWWHDFYPKTFASLSVFVMFALLVVGTYMLINDLAREEHRGTLNFIRLSPQSTQSILSGKLLGVPFLLYLAAILTVPLHLWLGLTAQIPLGEIISFWAVLVASCAFFYSAALLFGIVSSWLGGFQPWFGSGAVLFILSVTNNRHIDHSPADWLNLFSPSVFLPYLVDRTGSAYTEFPFSQGVIQGLEWFYLPLGATGIGVVIFALLNCGLWTYWIWQGLNRRFHNPNTTILSKRQSYLMIACSTVATLGFAMQSARQGFSSQFFYNFHSLLFINLLLFVGLIAALSPHRQALQDWARYRRSKRSTKGLLGSSLVQDLIWGEKSPALGAIALNLLITSVGVVGWILLWHVGFDRKLEALLSLFLSVNLILLYAALTQLMLFMKTKKRALWAAGTVATASFLPPFVLSVLSIYPGKDGGGWWLLTAVPWDAMKFASTTLVVQAFFVQWTILSVLSLVLTRQLRRAGESESKALFAGRPSLPQ